MANCRLLLVLSLLFSASASANDSPYLFVIPAERAPDAIGELGPIVEATLHVPNGGSAARLLEASGAVGVLQTRDKEVIISLGADNTMSAPPDDRHRQSSFVIDYGEPALENLVSEVRSELGESPGITELTNFVFTHIDDKHYRSSFDLASKVAATGSGDCTEHAVLLTALARATGKASRVIIGVQLMEFEDRHLAFGHAWSEIHDGNDWQVADATISTPADEIVRIRYLPIISLDNEGPGYAFDMSRMVRAQPSKVSNIRSSEQIR